MSRSTPIHPLAAKLKQTQTVYLTSFSRIPLAALFLLSLLASACGPVQPGLTTSEPQVTASVSVPGLTPTSRTSQKGTPQPAQTASPTLAVDAARLQGVHVRFWYVLPGGPPTNLQADAMQSLVADFNRSNTWGVTVEATSFESYAGLFQQVDSPQGGDMPDLLLGYPYQLRSLDASTHLLVNLQPYVQDPHWGLTAQAQADFNPLFWQEDVSAGKRLGLPFSRSAQVLYYNISLAKELGFNTAPVTPAEFSSQACASAQANRRSANAALQGTGGWVVNSDVPTMQGWLDAFGAAILASDGQTYALSSTQTTQAFNFLKDLSDKSCAWSAQDSAPAREFAARQALFLAGSLAGLEAQAAAFRAAGSKDDWTVIPFPSPLGKPVAIAYGPSFAVLQTNPDKQLAAWSFARWMVSPQNQARWIQNNASLPLGAQVLPLLADYKAAHPQWAAALQLLPDLRLEPQAASWDTVRWSLSDAGDRLFSPLFPATLIPQLVSMLNDTAAELAGRAH